METDINTYQNIKLFGCRNNGKTSHPHDNGELD